MKKQLEDFWKDKVVIITGHTGFKGSWLTLFLKHLGAEVHGISREKKNGIYEKAKIGEICSSENFLLCDLDQKQKFSIDLKLSRSRFWAHSNFITFESNLVGGEI